MRQSIAIANQRVRTWLALVIAATVLASLVILSGTIFGFNPSSAATTTPACTTSDLVVWLNTQGNGAAGSSYYSLNFTNLSAHSCTLYGYPGVSAVESSGIQLGSAASRSSATPAIHVTLASARSASAFDRLRGTTASVVLQITVAQNFPTSACKPITAAGLRVYPPGQRESTFVPYPFISCAKAGPRFLHVGVVQKMLSIP